ncbi:hypothetical protein AB0H83_18575 [Dactylosporangium sp. NPDC050688]|uniref:hypothetical protein n=1 Tax=Dactylosporangium sp. NPDC050688 TaxID=3157217 RepID=UPI0033F1C6BC
MNAIDVALAAGGAMILGFGLLLLRRRRARKRLDRLSRHRRSTGMRRRWPKADRLAGVLVDRPGVAVTAGGAVAGGVGLLAGGPVAAVLATVYATLGLTGVRAQLTRRSADRAIGELLDAIEDAAADLRAGVVPFATAAPYPGGADVEVYAAASRLPGEAAAQARPPGDYATTARPFGDAAASTRPRGDAATAARPRGDHAAPVPARSFGGHAGLGATVRRIWEAADERGHRATAGDRAAADHAGSAGPPRGGRSRRRDDAAVLVALARLEAAHRVSEALGTPLADLLDQVDADLRAGQALRLNLAAQTSGAQTTTALLVGLPAAGLWLGAGIGVDPVGQLLHTPLGAACAVTAVALQCAGLLWTGRMVRSVAAGVR